MNGYPPRRRRHRRRQSRNKGVFCVAIYLVDQAYGGPEEGDWYYTAGDLSEEPEHLHKMRMTHDEASAYAYARRLNDTVCALWNVGRRSQYSVLSEGVYEAQVHEGPCPKHFPAVRPHYE